MVHKNSKLMFHYFENILVIITTGKIIIEHLYKNNIEFIIIKQSSQKNNSTGRRQGTSSE